MRALTLGWRLLLAVSGLCFSAALVTACGDTSGPGGDSFTLATINGQPLPGPFPDPLSGASGFLEVTAGTLVLRTNGTFRQVHTVRCRTSLPPGTSCSVSNSQQSAEGTYSRTDAFIDYQGSGPPDNRFHATFGSDEVTINIGYPPSLGFFANFTLVYRR